MVSISCWACSRVTPSAIPISKNLPWRTSAIGRITEAVERRTDRLALRVQHGGLQRYEDASFHGKSDYLTQTARNVLVLDSDDAPASAASCPGSFRFRVGGLTVLDALRRRMPHRDFVYVGDTARAPYGRKPPAMVAGFAAEIVNFLCGLGVEGVVIACNTASAVALPRSGGELPTCRFGA